MRDDRLVDRWTAAEIDREIAATLAEEPSPEFVARLRARIASEPPAAISPWRWFPAAAAATLVVVATLVGANLMRDRATRESRTGLVAANPDPSPTTVLRSQGDSPPARHSVKLRAKAVRTPGGEPEVLIARGEIRALQRYLHGLRNEQLYLVVGSEETSGLQPSSELVIPPIKMDPIAPDSNEQGVRQ